MKVRVTRGYFVEVVDANGNPVEYMNGWGEKEEAIIDWVAGDRQHAIEAGKELMESIRDRIWTEEEA